MLILAPFKKNRENDIRVNEIARQKYSLDKGKMKFRLDIMY